MASDREEKKIFFPGFFILILFRNWELFQFRESIKTNTLILLGIVGAVGYFLWSRARAVGGLIFLPRGISFSGGPVQVTLGVQNPSSVAVPIESFAASLYINGVPLGSVSNFNPVLINPSSETPVLLNISPNVFGLANEAINLVRNGLPGSYSARLTGSVNVGGVLFPVDQNLS